MNVPPAWRYATGEDVNVAVIDTGYVMGLPSSCGW